MTGGQCRTNRFMKLVNLPNHKLCEMQAFVSTMNHPCVRNGDSSLCYGSDRPSSSNAFGVQGGPVLPAHEPLRGETSMGARRWPTNSKSHPQLSSGEASQLQRCHVCNHESRHHKSQVCCACRAQDCLPASTHEETRQTPEEAPARIDDTEVL